MCLISKTAVVFASRPRWPQIFDTSLPLATPQRWTGTMEFKSCCLSLDRVWQWWYHWPLPPGGLKRFFPVSNWSCMHRRDVKPQPHARKTVHLSHKPWLASLSPTLLIHHFIFIFWSLADLGATSSGVWVQSVLFEVPGLSSHLQPL